MIPARRLLAAVSLAVASLVAGCAQPPPPRTVEPLPPKPTLLPGDLMSSPERQVREQTWRVRVHRCDGLGIGSAFTFDDNLLVTNRHVVDRFTEIEVSSWDGRELEVVAVGVAEGLDLAVLTVAETLTDPVPIADAPEAGEAVTVVGFPDGGEIRLSEGVLRRVVDGSQVEQRSELLVLDAEVRRGNSGGPVFHDGKVVGVVFAVEVNSGEGLALPAALLGGLLDENAFMPQAITRC